MARNGVKENIIFTIYITEIFDSHLQPTFNPVAIDTKHNLCKLNLY